MFYHIKVGITGVTSWIEKNLSKDEALLKYLCPFISKEITFSEDAIRNMSSYGSMRVFSSDKPIDSDWPVEKNKIIEREGELSWQYKYDGEIIEALEKNEITEPLFREALSIIEHGKYQNYKDTVLSENKSKSVFMICPFGNDEIDHNYEYVIKPAVERYGLSISRVDQISHTQTITDKIIESINRSLFVIADLSDAKPNCYYEVGYAHSLGKPVVILAKEGTTRHFDISAYKWNHWTDYKDLKPKLEKELVTILSDEADNNY